MWTTNLQAPATSSSGSGTLSHYPPTHTAPVGTCGLCHHRISAKTGSAVCPFLLTVCSRFPACFLDTAHEVSTLRPAEGPPLPQSPAEEPAERPLQTPQSQPPSGVAGRSLGLWPEVQCLQQSQPTPSSQPEGDRWAQAGSGSFLVLLCRRPERRSITRSSPVGPPSQGPPCTRETSTPLFRPWLGH